MKKFLVFCLIAFPMVAMAEDDFGFKIPEWSEFAPATYVNVEKPTKLGKLNKVSSYWYERRVEFESALADCEAKASNDERFTCYEELKSKQYRENTDYNARIEAQRPAYSGIQEMSSRTDTMLPINSYINSITRFQPNEIR